MYDPTGALSPTSFTTGNAAGPAGSNNAWLMFYSGNGNYVLDNFTTEAFSNNDGNMNWTADWVEYDGTQQNPTAGNIRIDSGELRMHGSSSIYNPPHIYREVDLSPTGLNLTSAFLSFSYRTSGNLELEDSLDIQVSNNGGGNYTTLDTFNGNSTNAVTYDISFFIASNTRIRFRVHNTTGSLEFFYIDNVQIADGNGPLYPATGS